MVDYTARIIETQSVGGSLKSAVFGLPDIGLVGSISTSYILNNLKAKEVGYVDSDALPPIMIMHDAVPKEPARLFVAGSLAVLLAEVPLSQTLMQEIIKSALSWFRKKGISEVFSLGGVAVDNRQEIEHPEAYVTSTSEEKRKLLANGKLNILKEGIVSGPFATLMRESYRSGITNTVVLAEAYESLPDPEAAVSVIGMLGQVGGPTVDPAELNKLAEEVRLKTKEFLRKYEPPAEPKSSQIPMMYG